MGKLQLRTIPDTIIVMAKPYVYGREPFRISWKPGLTSFPVFYICLLNRTIESSVYCVDQVIDHIALGHWTVLYGHSLYLTMLEEYNGSNKT